MGPSSVVADFAYFLLVIDFPHLLHASTNIAVNTKLHDADTYTTFFVVYKLFYFHWNY